MHRFFRWILAALLAGLWSLPAALALPAPVPAGGDGTPALLEDAFNKLMANQGHWAYRESRLLAGLPGAASGLTVLLVDPSKDYPEQYLPLEVEGQAPTHRDLEQFQRTGERVAKRRQKEQDESRGLPGDTLKIRINFRVIMPDLARATVIEADERTITFNVPLRAERGAGGSDYDQFQVTARVSRERREFVHATIRQRQPIRIALVAKVSDSVIDLDFATIDPRFPSVITTATQRGTLGFLFMKRVVTFELRRGEFRHVTPYDERFGVKLGPLRTVEF
jgi:hypothetical protein